MTSLIFTTLTELSELLASYHIQNITTCTEGKIYCTLYAYAYDILPLLASKTNFFFNLVPFSLKSILNRVITNGENKTNKKEIELV